MKYSISISTCFDYDIPLEKQMEYISKTGFTHISLGSNLEHSRLFQDGRVMEIKSMLSENGLSIDTVHFSKTLTSAGWYEEMEKTMQAASELGCAVIVVHCSDFMGRDVETDKDAQMLKDEIKKLEDLCKKYKVKAALENLFPGRATDVVEKMLEYSDSAYIGFCYDSSHDQIDGPRESYLLERNKDRLLTMHISDRIKPFVDHILPGEGFIDFDEIAAVLNRTKIDFPILMEVKIADSEFKKTEIFLQKAFECAKDFSRNIT